MIFTKARLLKGKCIYRKHENLVENMFHHAETSFPQRFISFCHSPHRTCNYQYIQLLANLIWPQLFCRDYLNSDYVIIYRAYKSLLFSSFKFISINHSNFIPKINLKTVMNK